MTEIKLKDMTEEQIADLEAQISELRKAKERKPLAWKPEVGEEYYVVRALDGIVKSPMWKDLVFESCAYEQGNCFPTKELAEAELERRKVIRQIEELVDKYDSERGGAFIVAEENYVFEYKVETDKIEIASSDSYCFTTLPYISTIEVTKRILNEVGEDRVKLLFTKYPIVRGDE